MRANNTTAAERKDAPNTTFDARDVLFEGQEIFPDPEGRYDDATVRHAVEALR